MNCEPLCGNIGPHVIAMLQREARMKESFISAALWHIPEATRTHVEDTVHRKPKILLLSYHR